MLNPTESLTETVPGKMGEKLQDLIDKMPPLAPSGRDRTTTQVDTDIVADIKSLQLGSKVPLATLSSSNTTQMFAKVHHLL